MKTVFATLVLFLLCGFSSCNRNAEEALSEAANCFTLGFYKQLAKNKGSMVSSPFSLDVLLSLLRLGSGGKTEQELARVLGYQQLSVSDMQGAFESKLEKLKGSRWNTLEVANSVWIEKNFTVEQSFRDAATKHFYAEINNVDFLSNSQQATNDINSWGSTKTHGLIPVLFNQPLDASTVMVLVNAIYFKGQWKTKFEKHNTNLGNFYNGDSKNSPSQVRLMKKKSRFSYHEDQKLNAQVLEMDYAGEDMSMVILLPKEGSNLANLEGALTCPTFKGAVGSGRSTLVNLTMPKFEISSSYDLITPMMNIGIKDVFSPVANFSGIAKGIAVSKAIQKAVIKVYEEGSEAAVLTGITVSRTTSVVREPVPVVFRADHPFIYLIRDKRTNLVLFMGRVKDLPNAS